MITPDLRAPAMAEMARLSNEDLGIQQDGAPLVLVMKRLDLGCYIDPRGYYWFGANSPHVAEHSRWLAVVEKRALYQAGSWSRVEFASFLSGTPQLPLKRTPLVGGFAEVLEQIEGVLNDLPVSVAPFNRRGEFTISTVSKALQIWCTIAYNAMDEHHMRLTWDQEMHDLIHHYDLWQTRHPETQGVPRDLVLRANGLSEYADWLQQPTYRAILEPQACRA
jgi:hypothetical protein